MAIDAAFQGNMHGKQWLASGAIYFLGLYLVGKMFYIFSGGTSQPADVALALVALLISPPGAFFRAAREQMALALLIVWIIIVNASWFVFTQKADFLISATYYMFNFLIVTAVFGARERNPELFDRVITRFLLISIAIQFAVVIFSEAVSGREWGTFKNPNQLAYWGVCALSILLIIRRNKTRLTDLPFLLMAMWCQVGSASRAGLMATMALLLIWGWFALGTPLRRLSGALMLALLLVAAALSPMATRYMENSERVSTAEMRLAKQSQQSELEVRNYTRISNFYQYTVFGAGEGYLGRFRKNASEQLLEIHSSFGTILFSYGLIGLALFVIFITRLAFSLPLSLSVYIIPSMIYGVTHQGLRFTFFWILLGLLMNIASLRRRSVIDESRPLTAGSVEGKTPKTPYHHSWEQRGRDFLLDAAAGRREQGRLRR